MKTHGNPALGLAAALLIAALGDEARAQEVKPDSIGAAPRADSGVARAAEGTWAADPAGGERARPAGPRIRHYDLSGPRIGFTMAAGNTPVYRSLRDHRMGRIVSQFGWHFEHQVAPVGRGPVLVTEAIPLVGGVEYGRFVPSLNLVLGLRTRTGWEFGMGPSYSIVGWSGPTVALLMAAGRTFDYGGVSLPLNLAVSTNPRGTRLTISGGYAIEQASR